MRAVVLSNEQNIKFLNENFINTWVLNTDMKRLRDAKKIEHPLASTIIHAWKKHSPVDCLIISPTLELMGRQPVNELLAQGYFALAQNYHTFLVEALARKLPGVQRDN